MEKFPETDFLLSAGDQVNKASNEEQYAGYLEHDVLKSLPMATVIGNHDSGSDAYSEHFNNPNVEWKVVSFHHSLYTVASHAYDRDVLARREQWVPVFDELGVDVVLMGHDHVYARTYVMDGLTPKVTENSFKITTYRTNDMSVVDTFEIIHEEKSQPEIKPSAPTTDKTTSNNSGSNKSSGNSSSAATNTVKNKVKISEEATPLSGTFENGMTYKNIIPLLKHCIKLSAHHHPIIPCNAITSTKPTIANTDNLQRRHLTFKSLKVKAFRCNDSDTI